MLRRSILVVPKKPFKLWLRVLALVLVVIIVMRRRGRKNKGEEEEFQASPNTRF
jgi:hypothetical protein